MLTVIPHLCCRNATAALDFYKRALDAAEVSRMPTPDGRIMHSEIRLGDARIFVVDEFPEHGGKSPLALGGTGVTIHLYVPDVDAAFARAVAAGATALMPPADMFWGDRYGRLRDPFGHEWSMATPKKQLSPEEVQAGIDAAAVLSKQKQQQQQ